MAKKRSRKVGVVPASKVTPKSLRAADYLNKPKLKGKRAETVNAHDAKPSMFAFRIKMNFFPQHGDELTNTEVGRKLRDIMTENDLTFDYDDLTIDVKNDTESNWNSPWPDERSEED